MNINDYKFSKGDVLIDIRTPQEFSAGHLENAVNIDFFDEYFLQNFENQVDKEKVCYIYCKSGGRAAKAMQLLENYGFTKIIHLEGGYDEFQK